MSTESDASPPADDSTLRWRVRPLFERPLLGLMGSAAVLATGRLVALTAGSGWVGALAAAGLVGVLHRFFFGVDYELDENGIAERTFWRRRRLAWSDVAAAEFGARGAWLAARGSARWPRAVKGLLVLYGRRRDDVAPALRAALGDRSAGTCAGRVGDRAQESG